MNKFAVYSHIRLTKKPSWLSTFRKAYLKEEYHVTLKQPCFIEKDQVSAIKRKLTALITKLDFKNNEIHIRFDKLVIEKEKESGGKTIMIRATNNKDIHILQKEVTRILKGYGDYVLKESKQWERNFKPHITIANSLGEKEYSSAKTFIGKDYTCEGIIDSFTFVYEKEDGRKVKINYKL